MVGVRYTCGQYICLLTSSVSCQLQETIKQNEDLKSESKEGVALQNSSQIRISPVIYGIFLTFNYMKTFFISQNLQA